MDTQIILDDIVKSYSNSELKNISKIGFLEQTRLNLIEKLRLQNNEKITKLVNNIKDNKNINNSLKIKDLSLEVIFYYFDKEDTMSKKESKFDSLEIVLCGQKEYQIYDKLNQNRYIFYKVLPLYGVLYSSKTIISSKISKKTALININIDNNSNK